MSESDFTTRVLCEWFIGFVDESFVQFNRNFSLNGHCFIIRYRFAITNFSVLQIFKVMVLKKNHSGVSNNRSNWLIQYSKGKNMISNLNCKFDHANSNKVLYSTTRISVRIFFVKPVRSTFIIGSNLWQLDAFMTTLLSCQLAA